MQKRAIIVPSGVMDSVTLPQMMAQGNYIRLLNGRNGINKDGKQGSCSDVKSFLQVLNPDKPTGISKIIGSKEDIAGKSNFFFLWNSNGYHAIYRYFNETRKIDRIYKIQNPGDYSKFEREPLGFLKNKLITHIEYVGGELIYNDSYGQMKSINMAKATMVDKLREYNLYLSPKNLDHITTYRLKVYAAASNVLYYTIDIKTNGRTLADRVRDIVKFFADAFVFYNQVITVESKEEYVLIKSNTATIDYISIEEFTDVDPTIQFVSTVVPNNFYPEKMIGLYTTPWGPLKEWNFLLAKSPPTKAPKVRYRKNYDLKKEKLIYAHVAPSLNTFNVTASTTRYFKIGSDNDATQGYYDESGSFVTGATVMSNLISAPPTSYWTSGLNFSRVKARIVLDVVVDFISGGGQINLLFQFMGDGGGGYSSNQLVLNNVQQGVNQFIFETEFEFGASNIYPLMQVTGVSSSVSPVVSVELLGGYIVYDTSPLVQRLDLSQAYMFAARYVYDNYQESVLGARSITAMPEIVDPNCIELDFADKYLSDPANVHRIINVILSCTTDGGLTWFDFKTMSAAQFVGENNQIYYFSGEETLIPLALTKANMRYHELPKHVESMCLIDERLFVGGIIEGYDAVPIDITLTEKYLDPTDVATYPTAEIHANVQASGNYGNFFKRGSTCIVGLQYMNDFDQISPVCISSQSRVNFRFYSEYNPVTGAAETNYMGALDYEIRHEPPSWATKFRFMRTRNLQHGKFLHWQCQVRYVDADYAPAVSPTFIEIELNIDDYNAQGNKIAFTFEKGDFVRFIAYGFPSPTAVPKYEEHQILAVTGGKVYIAPPSPLTIPQGKHSMEFFTANAGAADENVFEEFGEVLEIKTGIFNGVLKKYHAGGTQDQSYGPSPYNIVTPAKGRHGYNTGNVAVRSTFLHSQRDTMSDRSDVPAFDNARLNSTKLLGERVRYSAFRFSNQYINGTKLNGLNAFEGANDKQYSATFGKLRKMQVVNNDILRLIYSNSFEVSVYVHQGVIRQVQGGQRLMSVTDEVAGDSYQIQRNLGGDNPESVVANDQGEIYGFDVNQGVAWMGETNGLIQASDALMKATFHDIGMQRLALDRDNDECPAIYDNYYEEYIQSFRDLGPAPLVLPSATFELHQMDPGVGFISANISLFPSGITIYNGLGQLSLSNLLGSKVNAYGNGFGATLNPDGTVTVKAPAQYNNEVLQLTVQYNDGVTRTKTYQEILTGYKPAGTSTAFTGRTIAFNKTKGGWVSYYSFVPELYGKVLNQVLSFKDGDLWLHEQGVGYNNFYGVQYPRILTIVCNETFPAVNIYKRINVWGNGRVRCPKIIVPPTDDLPLGMESELTYDHFRIIEGGKWSDFKRNKLDVNYNDIDDAWVNGAELRGQVLIVDIMKEDANLGSIFSVDIAYLHSLHS